MNEIEYRASVIIFFEKTRTPNSPKNWCHITAEKSVLKTLTLTIKWKDIRATNVYCVFIHSPLCTINYIYILLLWCVHNGDYINNGQYYTKWFFLMEIYTLYIYLSEIIHIQNELIRFYIMFAVFRNNFFFLYSNRNSIHLKIVNLFA